MLTVTVVKRNVTSVNYGSHVSMRQLRLNGLSYSKLMHGLKLAGIEMNRKMLADLAVNDAAAFTVLADKAKEALAK